MQQVRNSRAIEAVTGDEPVMPSARLARQVGRGRRMVEHMLVLGGLTLAFLLAPTLQGINLAADQSTGTSTALRSADAVASAEVARLADQG